MNELEIKPTETGKKMYPPNGYHDLYGDGEDFVPCTCKPSCLPSCKGECGCEACHCAYGDFLSSQGCD